MHLWWAVVFQSHVNDKCNRTICSLFYSCTLYKHTKTVVFSGRPGGPGFYINLDKGDAKQHHHGDLGETSFGKVMQGRPVVHAMRNLVGREFGIQSVRLVVTGSK